MGMPYIKQALEEINKNCEKQKLIAKSKKELFYIDNPQIKKLDEDISSVFSSALKKSLDGIEVDFEKVKNESLKLQEKRTNTLKELGASEKDFEPDFNCKKCNDTGFFNGYICECVKKKAITMLYDELNKDVPLSECTFENYNLEYYPDECRDIMTKISSYCVNYAKDFTTESVSLFFAGNTGLGKTHLSLAIANEVIKKGYGVVYGPLSKIIGMVEKEHFSNDENKGALQNIIDSDLLILDDLGTEFTTSFVTTAIYDIINSRILNKKPTIINTNLSLEELEKKYSPRILSRISGFYKMFQFLGEDIRTLK